MMYSGVSISNIADGFQMGLGGLPIPLLRWRWLLLNFSQRVRDVDKGQYQFSCRINSFLAFFLMAKLYIVPSITPISKYNFLLFLVPSLFSTVAQQDLLLPSVLAEENTLTVFNHKLHRSVLCLRVLHLPRQTFWPHHRRRKDNGNVRTGHQILRL